MYCNFVHCTVVDIVMMYYVIIVSNVNIVSIVDKKKIICSQKKINSKYSLKKTNKSLQT